jgi:hypothetical protein
VCAEDNQVDSHHIVKLSQSNCCMCPIIDGPRGSLRRLRSQLAEDGCPESQVILAKHLLEEKCGKNLIIIQLLSIKFQD